MIQATVIMLRTEFHHVLLYFLVNGEGREKGNRGWRMHIRQERVMSFEMEFQGL